MILHKYLSNDTRSVHIWSNNIQALKSWIGLWTVWLVFDLFGLILHGLKRGQEWASGLKTTKSAFCCIFEYLEILAALLEFLKWWIRVFEDTEGKQTCTQWKYSELVPENAIEELSLNFVWSTYVTSKKKEHRKLHHPMVFQSGLWTNMFNQCCCSGAVHNSLWQYLSFSLQTNLSLQFHFSFQYQLIVWPMRGRRLLLPSRLVERQYWTMESSERWLIRFEIQYSLDQYSLASSSSFM